VSVRWGLPQARGWGGLSSGGSRWAPDTNGGRESDVAWAAVQVQTDVASGIETLRQWIDPKRQLRGCASSVWPYAGIRRKQRHVVNVDEERGGEAPRLSLQACDAERRPDSLSGQGLHHDAEASDRGV